MRLASVATILGLIALGGPAASSAQISKADQRCIAAFNKGLRTVTKAQGGVIKKCLLDYASGRLTASTAEDCIRNDAKGLVARAVAKAAGKAVAKCGTPLPDFGVTDIESGLTKAILNQIDLIHHVIGQNLNNALIANRDDAGCQARVGSALLKCSDRRLREYLKCQQVSLRNGDVTDAASLQTTCLGAGATPQPDPFSRINNECSSKIAATVGGRCGATNLLAAFNGCNPANDAAATAACMKSRSACQLCLLLNETNGLSRDCDLMDDGDASNGSCGTECGDGILQIGEVCDDGNLDDNDGCSSFCTTEGGYTCTGSPSVCTPNCGNGLLDAGEECDDGATQGGDGCSATCFVESGYSCIGQPSVCSRNCGNGTVEPDKGEQCDDGNQNNSDGCSNTCQVQPGYLCSGSPSVCTFVCGNGTFQTGETCDDNNAMGGDGCSSVCQIEQGWSCFGVPSICVPICGDGLKRGGESCDDGNLASGDGCSFLCQTEAGYQCVSQPSHCTAVCGDGFIRGFENCDDGNTISGDGCSGTLCRVETTHNCAGQPSVCSLKCGNGIVEVPELCDDGNHSNGDGCSANCLPEAGYFCAGQPSVCNLTCGNGVLDGSEQCDDGNANNNDGCSANCVVESGWICPTPGQPCSTFDIVIDSPANGFFTTAGSILVTGHYTTLPAGQVAVTINGVPASSLNQIARTFSHTVPLSQSLVFNPIRAVLTNTANGDTVSDRVVVIAGSSVLNGQHSPQSVAMRINDSGLDAIEPLVAQLAGGMLNLGALLPAGSVITSGCFIDTFLGCLGSATVRIANPPPSYGSFQLFMDSVVNSVFGDIRINNLRIDVSIQGSGLVPSCGLRLTANQLRLTGNYSLEPKVGDPSNIDVNLITPMGVTFSGFNHTFTSGLCDAPIIGDIIQALLPDIQQLAVNGIKGFLDDPDGAGPQDSPIAAAIEEVLAGISITGPVGEGLGLMLESPLFAVTEDNAGITFGSSAKFTVSIGTGPGQCMPPLGAPVLPRSYHRASVFPTFGANTPPPGNKPYGFGLGISASGFNQLLRGQTECGLMRTSLTDIDLDGAGPLPSTPITSTLLSLIIPEFAQLPPNTPLRIDIAPTIAPIVTGDPGPNGELTELKIAQVMMDVVQVSNSRVWLRGALDARLGLNLSFLPDGSGLAFSLSEPLASDLSIAIINNPLHTNTAQVETVLPALVRPLIPELAGALSGFPLPQFFGLSLQGVEVSRNGQFMSLFANMVPGP